MRLFDNVLVGLGGGIYDRCFTAASSDRWVALHTTSTASKAGLQIQRAN